MARTEKEKESLETVVEMLEVLQPNLRKLTYGDFIALVMTTLDMYVGLPEIADPVDVMKWRDDKAVDAFVIAIDTYLGYVHELRKYIAREKIDNRRRGLEDE